MRTLAVRRCAPAFPSIRWRGNVFRGLATPLAPGVRAAQAVTGATPLAEGSVRHSAECVFTPSPLYAWGRSRASGPCRKAVQRRLEAAEHPRTTSLRISSASSASPTSNPRTRNRSPHSRPQ